jgi:pre-rRNA-processing protein TSR3
MLRYLSLWEAIYFLVSFRIAGYYIKTLTFQSIRSLRLLDRFMLDFEIVVDKGEKPNKCTILPLVYRKDFKIHRPGRNQVIGPLTGDLLLHPEGELLHQMKVDHVKRLSLIDSNWKLLPMLLSRVALPLPKLARIPEGFVTAYPRKSKLNTDPDGGLATIEAMFIAAAFLGVWDETLFDKYHFGKDFLTLNAETFARFDLGPNT